MLTKTNLFAKGGGQITILHVTKKLKISCPPLIVLCIRLCL
jgi:hypothetical protein